MFWAVITDENGTTIELNSQEKMVPVITESNWLRQKQCKDTPFLTEPLVEIFGYLANPVIAQKVIDGTYVPQSGTPLILVNFLTALKVQIQSKKETKLVC